MRPASSSRFGIGAKEVGLGNRRAGEAGQQFVHQPVKRLQGTVDGLDGPEPSLGSVRQGYPLRRSSGR